jgi:outer membrane cobalamin receptor
MSSLRFPFFTAFLLFFLCFSTAHAQESEDIWEMSLEQSINKKTSVASSSIENIFNTFSTVTVIDQDMISKYNFASITEALRIVPGFDVLRTYVKRDVPTARGILQYHYANKVLVMINNVPCWNAVTGEAELSRINIENVERIEVLKGPASVQYGTNAYTGAINIILKNYAQGSNSSMYLKAGDKGFYNAGGQLVYGKDDFSAMISGNVGDEDGQDFTFTDEENVTGTIKEYVHSNDMSTQLKYKNHSLLFNTFKSHESYLGVVPRFAYSGGSGGAGNDHWGNGYLLNYQFNSKLFQKYDIQYSLTYDWNQRDLSRSADDNIRSAISGRRLTNSLRILAPLSSSFTAEAGFDHDARKAFKYDNYDVAADMVISDNNMANRSANEYSFFGQLMYDVDKLKFVVGSRYTNNSIFGDNLSSRASVIYQIDKKNALKLILGQSFRAPSFFEQYFQSPTFTVMGSTDLKPETSTSIEMAYVLSRGNIYLQALVYHAWYQNKIFRDSQYNPIANAVVEVYINGSEFEANGFELEAKYKDPKLLDVFVNYYYVDGNSGDEVNNSGNYNFRFVPKHTLAFGLYKSYKSFFASTVLNYKSDVEGPIEKIEAAYTVDFNFGFNHKWSKLALNHCISVKDITDSEYFIPEYVRRNTVNQVPFGYGRRVQYTIRVNF